MSAPITHAQTENYIFVKAWGSTGNDNGQFNLPFGVATDSLGNVYVTDRDNDRIQKFDSNGTFLTTWGDWRSGTASSPIDVTVDSSGNVYVVEWFSNRVQKFNSSDGINYNLVTTWGSSGKGIGQFDGTAGVAVDSSGNVYVTDTYNGRIQKFNDSGGYITQWAVGTPYGIAVDSSGSVYVACCGSTDYYYYNGIKYYYTDSIMKFDSNGNLLTSKGFSGSHSNIYWYPSGVAIDSSGNVYVADTYNNCIHKFSSNCIPITEWGSSGSGDGQFYDPRGVAFDQSGNVYVADSGNNRIQKFAVSSVFPVANFTSNVTKGYAPLTVKFTDLSENATEWNWDFGDGNNSTEQNPVNIFSAAGNYTINLTASNVNGKNSKSATINVSKNDGGSTVSINIPANPLWTDTGLKVVKGQTVFIQSSGTWNTGFGECGPDGDGDNADLNDIFLTSAAPSKHGELIAFVGSQSTDPYQGHWGDSSFFPQPTGVGYWAISSSATFTADRDGELWLGINDDAVSKGINDNSGLLSTTVTVTTQVGSLPVANFTSNLTNGYAPLSIQFKDSSENMTGWKWDFGDGSTSTEQNPTHTYSAARNYTVNLTVSNAYRTDSKVATITVLEKTILPVANFSGNPTSGKVPLTVVFTDASTEMPTKWKWTFGDGTTSTKQNIMHKYSQAGNYTVTLTVSNTKGSNTVTKAGYIQVTAKPVANFTSSVTSGKAPLNVAFTDTSTGTPTSWKWTFGDGTSSIVQNPTHKYSKAGNYTVNLTVKNLLNSSTLTKTGYIQVTEKPVAAFSISPTSGKAPLNVAFTDQSTGTPTKWKWSFGDGTTSTKQSITHKYSKAGSYTVALTVSNGAGSNTVTKTGYVIVK